MMESAAEIAANQVMGREPFTVSVEDSISSVKNSMEDRDLRAVAVLGDGERLKGAVGYRDLVRHLQFNPEKTSLEKVMHNPPGFDESMSLVELAELRINSGRKLLVSETPEGSLNGVVGDEEFFEVLSQVSELQEISIERIVTRNLFTVEEADTIERARHLILDENISRLPVVDGGDMTGMLRSTDILRTLVPKESQSSGGTSGGRTGEEVRISGGGEKQRMSDVPVSEIMSRSYASTEGMLSPGEALELMEENGVRELVFTESNEPEAILTLKDYVQAISDLSEEKTVLVSLIGLEMPEEKAAVHRKIRTQVQGSLGRKMEEPEEIRLHVKKREKDGRKHRYEINLKVLSEHGMLVVDAEDWDLLDAVDEALQQMDSRLRKAHDRSSSY